MRWGDDAIAKQRYLHGAEELFDSPADAELLPVVCSGKEFYNNNNKGEYNED